MCLGGEAERDEQYVVSVVGVGLIPVYTDCTDLSTIRQRLECSFSGLLDVDFKRDFLPISLSTCGSGCRGGGGLPWLCAC